MSSEQPLPTHPPSYSPNDDAELPSYHQRRSLSPSTISRPANQKDFHTVLKRKGEPFVTLTLTANETIGKVTPTYVEGTPITGRVCLDLDKPQSIQEVTVTVKGSLVLSENPAGQQSFLKLHTKLWSPSDWTPSPINLPNNRKLNGKVEWSFSIDLPREVAIPYGPRMQIGVFKLPQTFLERHARISILYEVYLKISRSKFKPDYRVNHTFGYIPLIRPGLPSYLRQLAYQEDRQIPSPDIDPDGWHMAEPTQIRGKAFGRSVDVTCKLFLPIPLSYTRGTAIPLSLLLESEDVQALDLLSHPKAIVCRLRRVSNYRVGHEMTFEAGGWKDDIEDSQLASWWPCREIDANSRKRRRVTGEIHLRKDLKPTSAMAGFRIEYSLVLFPFDSVAFLATPSTSEPLVSLPVEIATMYPRGPPPRMYAPPGYESSDTHIYSPWRPEADDLLFCVEKWKQWKFCFDSRKSCRQGGKMHELRPRKEHTGLRFCAT